MWTLWQKILDEVTVKDDAVGEVEWVISVDSSAEEDLGRSRGGLSTKIHLAVDGRGRPMPDPAHARRGHVAVPRW